MSEHEHEARGRREEDALARMRATLARLEASMLDAMLRALAQAEMS